MKIIIIFLSFASVVIARRGVKKEQSICSLPKQAGLCDAYFPRFYFDKSTGECKRFIFGGCGGNANNFRTMDACQNACVCGENQHFNDCGTSCPLTCDNYNNPPETCNKMCNPGCHCNRGYVKSNDGKCVKPENCPVKSRVGTEKEQSICSLPKEAGLCDAYFPRFYFDKSTGECKRFVYGGCGGNANNFRKMKDCQNACVCGTNQRYNECATSCPLTCDNYDNPPDTCTKMCNPGCQCEKGYVESNDGQCVKPENCPAEAGHP